MLKSILLAGVLAVTAMPAVSLAQPDRGYSDDNRYGNSDNSYGDNGQNDDAGARDSGRGGETSDNNGNDDHAYNGSGKGYYGDQDHHYYNNGDDGHAYGSRVFTGRVGSSWWDQGRRCQWREVTWRDHQGDPAYKWVTVCED